MIRFGGVEGRPFASFVVGCQLAELSPTVFCNSSVTIDDTIILSEKQAMYVTKGNVE